MDADPPVAGRGAKPAPHAWLEVDIHHRFPQPRGAPDFVLETSFRAREKSVVLYGPSGSGKTTVLRAIAGLLAPRGSITLLGDPVLGARHVPPEKRGIAFVTQEPRLFPHLSVRENLLYGAGAHGPAPGLATLAERLGIAALLDRVPAGLSGGEAHRVALGRALLSGPRALLCDEPFTGLDAPLRREMRRLLRDYCSAHGVPLVLVTHLSEEALAVGQEVVVLRGGRVEGRGAPRDVLLPDVLDACEPGAEVVALLSGVVRVVDRAGGEDGRCLARIDVGGCVFEAITGEVTPGEEVRLEVRAEDVALMLSEPTGHSARNTVRARVVALSPRGEEVLVRLDAGFGFYSRITRLSAKRLNLSPGDMVLASVKATALRRV